LIVDINSATPIKDGPEGAQQSSKKIFACVADAKKACSLKDCKILSNSNTTEVFGARDGSLGPKNIDTDGFTPDIHGCTG